MERELFTWKDWDVVEEGISVFEDCILLVAIGEHPVGEKIDMIVINSEKGVIFIYKNKVMNDPDAFNIHYRIGNKFPKLT